MVSKEELERCIVNINHNSDNQLKMITVGFARNDEQHNNLITELIDLKKEMILLRKDSNKIIYMAFIILGGVLGLSKLLGLFI